MENCMETVRMPLIGDTAPSFEAVTTQGKIKFPEDLPASGSFCSRIRLILPPFAPRNS